MKFKSLPFSMTSPIFILMLIKIYKIGDGGIYMKKIKKYQNISFG
jgi:hypothetical protein